MNHFDYQIYDKIAYYKDENGFPYFLHTHQEMSVSHHGRFQKSVVLH